MSPDESTLPVPGDAGVQFNAPPAEIIRKVNSDIQGAVDAIGRNFDVAAVAIADRKGGWNTAIVGKVGEPNRKWGELGVLMWIGKSYGTSSDLDYGARLLWAKKF
jgi:hypothetical protein